MTYESIRNSAKDFYTNPNNGCSIPMTWCDACEEINLWTYWQGLGYEHKSPKPQIDVLVVGQDWGNLKGNSQQLENIRKINASMSDGKEPVQYFDGINIEKAKFITDCNLCRLFYEVFKYDILNNRYDNLFFTNFCLGYRIGKSTGGMSLSQMENDKDRFKELVDELKPKAIACLGKLTYESVVCALTGQRLKINGYNRYLNDYQKNNGLISYNSCKIYPMAHPGRWGEKNRGGFIKLKTDWENLKEGVF